MENLDHNIIFTEDIAVTSNSTSFLATSAKWAKIIAIISFLTSGLLALFFMYRLISILQMYSPRIDLLIPTLVYLIIPISLIFPSIYLLRFSNEMKDSIANSHKIGFEIAFENLKSYFKFMGVFSIIVFALILLLIVFLTLLVQGF